MILRRLCGICSDDAISGYGQWMAMVTPAGPVWPKFHEKDSFYFRKLLPSRVSSYIAPSFFFYLPTGKESVWAVDYRIPTPKVFRPKHLGGQTPSHVSTSRSPGDDGLVG